MYELLWYFHTRHFSVELHAEPETAPDLSWDETGETQANVESGLWSCVCFRVRVMYGGRTIATDYLGDSIYADVHDFYRQHREGGDENRNCLATKTRNVVVCHYFPDMIRNAVAGARASMLALPCPPRMRRRRA
jgi:hypothetical protein